MSLKIKGWRKIIKWSICSVLFVLFVIFLVKVATFEADYYSKKEGSERAAAQAENGEDLIEIEPTDDEVREYIVAPDRPRYLRIDKLGITGARILPMGVNASGELATPNNIFDVGWYEASGKPGQGGTMIIDGHNGGPHVLGVFKSLPDLTIGDIIEIERGDGVKFKYAVADSEMISLDDANAYMAVAAKSPTPGEESVTLISCTGEWSQQQRTYLSRQFVRAVLIED